MKLTRVDLIFNLLLLFGYYRRVVEGTYSIMDITAPVWKYKRQMEAGDEEVMERPDDRMNAAIEKEMFHTRQRTAKADALTETTTILITQYLSLLYAIQFGRGFAYFKEANDSERSTACLKLAYYLAWFGLESDYVFASLGRILRTKYARNQASYAATVANLSRIRDILKRVQRQLEKPAATVFDSEDFTDRAFRTSVETVGLFFREAVLGKTIVSYEQVFDWTGEYPQLWSRADQFLEQLCDVHEAKYLNVDSGRENAFKSNIVSILRSIELVNVEKNFGDDFAKKIQTGLEGKFLIAKLTGSDGKLKFHVESHSLPFDASSSELMETKETPVPSEGGFTLLGTRHFGGDHTRILMEIIKMCIKSEDYAARSSVWKQEKNYGHWITYSNKSKFVRSNLPQIRLESKNVYWQSHVATYLTDLYSIFFVQYLALIYSIRFAHGFAYFRKENKMTEAAQCAKVTYFLAWYGIDSELVLLATERILREKYPEELPRIWNVKRSISEISSIIYERIIRKYNSSEGKIDFEASYFESEELTKSIQTLNLYFKDLIFFQSSESDENIVDIKGSEILWNKADIFDDMIDVIQNQSYLNLYPGIAETFASSAVSMVQFAEILSASGKFQADIPGLVTGLEKGNFLVRRHFDRKLHFTKIETDNNWH